MKKRNLNILFFSIATAITLASCNESNQSVTANYKITFDTNGGTLIDTIEAAGASKISAPINPSKAGYDFIGWFSDQNFDTRFQFSYMPKKDITLYAKWSLKSFVINYEVGLGENNPNNPSVYNITQNDIKLNDPVYDGYNFGGWFTDSDYTNKVSLIDTTSCQDYNLYAKWTDNDIVVDYDIVYHLYEGTNGNNPTTFNRNDDTIYLLPATRDGYTFDGWFSDEALNNQILSINTQTNGPIDVYAKWTKTSIEPVVTSYSITYHLNGGTNGSNPIRYYENTANFDLVNPTKISCTFKGWYLDEDFTVPVTTIDCSAKKNLDIYAKWVNGITEINYEFDLGIGKEYVLYHISDAHVNAGSSESDIQNEISRLNSRFDYANSFGEKYDTKNMYKSSAENFKALVSYVNSEKPDAVCYSGDIMDYYSQANFDFVKQEMSKTEAPFVYAMGNHENPSSNYTDMCGNDTVEFTVREFDDFEIVCLDNSNTDANSCYYYTENQYEKLLAETQKDKPIIIVEHVPLLTSENCDSRIEKCGSYFFIDENSCSYTTSKVIELIKTNENIKLVLCGHIHGGTYTYIAPNKPELTCSFSLSGFINKITIK